MVPFAAAVRFAPDGDDVSDVAVNNLQTGTTYEFELLACDSHLFSSSDCTGWQPIGTGAPG